MRLDHLGVIEARGPDAASFLHSQFTNDVQHLKADGLVLNAYCQAKGRMLASFWLWRQESADGPVYRLALSADVLPSVLKRLSMFVLRAKVTLSDVSAQVPVWGWVGGATDVVTLPANATGPLSAKPQTAPCCQHTDVASIAWIPAPLSLQRAFVIAPPGADPQALDTLAHAVQSTAPAVDAALWRWLDLHAGIARIEAQTQEAFVPQMVNFELVGGVSFKKGCYPGQEVVARSQYLGKLKRRTFLGRTAAVDVTAGADVSAPDASEPVGRIVNAAPNAVGGTDVLLETTLAAADGPLLVRGSPITRLPLPYPFPAETP